MTTPPVTLRGSLAGRGVAHVDDVRVRFTIGPAAKRWRCDEHGETASPTCWHAVSTAAALAEAAFGLPVAATQTPPAASAVSDTNGRNTP